MPHVQPAVKLKMHSQLAQLHTAHTCIMMYIIYVLATQITDRHTEHSHENRLGIAAGVLKRDNITNFECKLLFRNHNRFQGQAIKKL